MTTTLKPLKLDDSIDSVELKLTVPHGEGRATARALGIDLLDVQLRQIYFFDTPDLALYEKGIVLRARRIQKDDHDCVVKLRPVIPGQIDPRWRQSDGMVIEVDVVGGKPIYSASLKAVRRPSQIEEVLEGKLPLPKLFRKEQRAFLSEHAPTNIPWDRLVPLGPINVGKLKTTPNGLGYPTVVEVWYYPDGSNILELSVKVKPKRVEQARQEGRAFIESIGLKLGGEQQTKTRKALLFFAKKVNSKS